MTYTLTDKYTLTDIRQDFDGVTLYRIKALRKFSDVNEGDLGGWVQSESNLTQSGNSWIYDDACAYGQSLVSGNATLSDEAIMSGNAIITENVIVLSNAQLKDNCYIDESVRIGRNIIVSGTSELSGSFTISSDVELTLFE